MCHLLAWMTAHRGSRSNMGQMTDTYYFLRDRSDAFFKMQVWLCQKLSCNYNSSWLRIKILLWPVLAYCSRDSSVFSHTMAKPTLFILTGPSLATMCPILYNPDEATTCFVTSCFLSNTQHLTITFSEKFSPSLSKLRSR